MASTSPDGFVLARIPLAERLFDEIERRTSVDGAIVRAPFGNGEQAAADLIGEEAKVLGLEVAQDWVGNVYMTWRAPCGSGDICMAGSHLDSVPRGGNYDGLAGILAGLVAVAAMKDAHFVPRRDITIMAIRAEESAWFGAQHIGSQVALGLFDPSLLDRVRRIDTSLTLAEHIVAAGFDVEPIRQRRAFLERGRVRCFLELHIEQGPILEEESVPTGVVTGIRGNVRCARCECVGAYEHSGTVPRALRRDAVIAVSELVSEMDRLWAQLEAQGEDLVLTFGRMSTDPSAHSVTTIPGVVHFSFDARSHTDATLTRLKASLVDTAERIGKSRNVEFRFGAFTGSPAIALNQELRNCMLEEAVKSGIRTMEIASGAGHDTGDFASAGVPAAMVFVRNAHGSHNPAETMSLADFGESTRLLTAVLARQAAC
jgi:beta-ureidopropionase / N-carbamoyl-L-amino-acid hydrolase